MFSSSGSGSGSGSSSDAVLKVVQKEKFCSRVFSKESAAANPSFRVYYGVASGAVPFHWESRPGTPKHTKAETTLPPLTPPPSYFFKPPNYKTKKKSPSKSPKHYNIIHVILPRLALRKPHGTAPQALSVSSSTTSTSSGSQRAGRSSSPMSSFSSNSRGEDDQGLSPTSTLCFAERLVSMVWMKKHRSSNGSRHGAAA